VLEGVKCTFQTAIREGSRPARSTDISFCNGAISSA
jgi:hypothetical protein